MKILMIDVGGTNVKLMATGRRAVVKVPSGRKMTAARMIKEVLKATEDWDFQAITIGYPGVVRNGQPASEPPNVGGGWLRIDFKKAFGKPVRFINDAGLQALAAHRTGRMLYLGFGTSTGATLIVDDVIVPLEVGSLCLPDGKRFGKHLSDKAFQKRGQKRWKRTALAGIELLREVFKPDHIMLGGGNSDAIRPLPPDCSQQDNRAAFRGAVRLWPGADMLAEPYGASWRITRRKTKKSPK
ncbi:polyphosphate glucokinase [Roseimicrobium gellanilyticum]|uniref:Polyphosphate glucokinase n=1 Tax=Roseimicrobium gellanilyticum TaxID=748857 RepID=A0A366HJ65_9BACT|nr:ROK family protein [Roseimicrobium gellanilyticum]RBP42415.1 polyphosphate glucokinase [Roseimicrobium gellanilyticum]